MTFNFLQATRALLFLSSTPYTFVLHKSDWHGHLTLFRKVNNIRLNHMKLLILKVFNLQKQ